MKARRLFAVAAMAVAILFPLMSAAPASASTGEFLSKINALRASKGLAGLSLDSRLNSVAAGWNAKMAAAGKISHNPSFSSQISGNWTKVGENVGTGGSVDSIFNALVASPGHYRNMVDPAFTSIGLAVTTGGDGRLYTTHNFAAFPGAGGGAAAKAAPAAGKAAPKANKPAAPKPAAKTTRTAPPVPVAPPAPAAAPAPAAPVAPPAPQPSISIQQGLIEIVSISTQG